MLFSIVAEPIYVPIRGAQVTYFLHILSNTCYFCFGTSHSNKHKVMSHCGLLFISLMLCDVKHLFMFLLAI